MDFIYTIDLVGTFVFAVSGVVAARENKLDVFGALVLAIVTAVGGGTVRDLMIGVAPVSWILDVNYIILITLAVPFTILLFGKLNRLKKTLFLFDTIGIGLFTILGINKSLAVGLEPGIALMMGVISATFGGVLRDTLTNVVPLIFRKRIYATACLVGGLLYLGLKQVIPYPHIDMAISMLVVMIIRILAIKRKWTFPTIDNF